MNILRLLRFFISLTFLSLFWPSLISRWRTHFREARLRDLDLDDSRKRGHVDVHLEFLHFSNNPPPTAAFPALCEVGQTIERRSFAAFR